MIGAFDDLIPAKEATGGRFDDLIPSMKPEGGAFNDLIPKETVSEGPVMGTLKAIPRVVAHTAASLVQMPVSGMAALGKLVASRGDLSAANKVLEENQRTLVEAYLTTPEERAGSENINLAMKPFQMAGEGLKEIVRLTPAKDTVLEPIAGTLGEASAMFGAGGVGKVARARLIPSGLDVMKPGDMPTLRPVTIPAEPTKGVLVGEPYGPPEAVTLRPPPVKMAPESLPAAGERSALPYPDYAGDGFTYKAASEAPDILRRDGKPFQSEAGAKAAMTREGVTDYEVVQVDDGFVARQKQTQGKEFRPEDAPPVSELDRIRLQVKAEDEARRQGATSLPKIEMGKVYPGRQEPPAAAPARPQGEISPNQEREKPEHHNNA